MGRKMKHARLGASSSNRWINCSGSVRQIEAAGIKDVTSAYAREGTVAHKLAERCLVEGKDPVEFLDETFHPYDDVPVNDDMVDSVRVLKEEVYSRIQADPSAVLLIEKQFDLSGINPPEPMYGTSDIVIFSAKTRRLTVIDLKYGQGVVVEVEGNSQLQMYGIGALLQFERDYPQHVGKIDDIELVIVQPRAAHADGVVRPWVLSYMDLCAFTLDLLEAAERTQVPDAPLTAGSWCRFCPAAPSCPAQAAHAVSVAQVEFADMPADLPPTPETLPQEVLLDVLDKAPILEDWLKSVRAHVFRLIESGHEVPGWKLVEKRAMRKWIAPEKVVALLTKMQVNPADIVKPVEIKSVAQIEKVFKKLQLDFADLNGFHEKKSSGYNLAPSSDGRPAALIGPQHDFGTPPTES